MYYVYIYIYYFLTILTPICALLFPIYFNERYLMLSILSKDLMSHYLILLSLPLQIIGLVLPIHLMHLFFH